MADTDTPSARADARFELPEGETLRQHAARGTLVNAVFNIGLTILAGLKGVVLPVFLTPEDYGIWGILLISLGTLTWLKQVGVADKYIQQEEADQELAFQRAFTMELIVNAILLTVLLVAVPIVALVYGRADLLLPGFALCLIVPALQMQVPFWILYRRLEFRRQRLLQAVDPLIAFSLTIGLAAAGAGYWALVLGALVGSWAGGLLAISSCPYPLAIRYDRGTLRSYVSFSWPLFVASLGGLVIAQGSILIGSNAVGIAGTGAIVLAAQISQLAQRVDDVVSATLYPVVCAVADRRELLYESFTKSNRVALMWAMPFGIGLVLFGPDLVAHVLGHRWHDATLVIQVTGAVAGVSQLAFNWTSYVRALGDTRPIAVNSVAQAVTFVLAAPLLYVQGVDGFASILVLLCLVSLATRTLYLRRIFEGFAMVAHALRALAPSVPALACVLLMRLAEGGGTRTTGTAVAELGVFAAVTIAATWAGERALIAEALGYVRRGRGSAAAA